PPGLQNWPWRNLQGLVTAFASLAVVFPGFLPRRLDRHLWEVAESDSLRYPADLPVEEEGLRPFFGDGYPESRDLRVIEIASLAFPCRREARGRRIVKYSLLHRRQNISVL